MFGQIGAPELIILAIVGFAGIIVVVPWWLILRKTGNSPALALLMLLPVANVVLLFWVALSEWPIERRARGLERS